MPVAARQNRLIAIQEKVAGAYPDGQPFEEWRFVVSGVWANIAGRTGLGAIVAAQDVPLSVAGYSVRIRYRLGLTAGMRVLEQGPDGHYDETSPYDIKVIQQDKDLRKWTFLVCEQGANNG